MVGTLKITTANAAFVVVDIKNASWLPLKARLRCLLLLLQ